MQLTIDAGTVILVADILQAERGLERPPIEDARNAILASVHRLSAAGAEVAADEAD